MASAGSGKNRPYLPSQERRRVLLDAAAETVARSGWGALTMKGVATAAGVSRQLVYDHFEDSAGLFLATVKHLFDGSYRATADMLQPESENARATVRDAYRVFLEMPGPHRRALRALAGDLGPDRPETRRAIALMRERILALWVPHARRWTGLPERELRPIVWMLIAAAWGLADLLEEGTVSEQEAEDALVHFVERVLVPARPVRKKRNVGSLREGKSR